MISRFTELVELSGSGSASDDVLTSSAVATYAVHLRLGRGSVSRDLHCAAQRQWMIPALGGKPAAAPPPALQRCWPAPRDRIFCAAPVMARIQAFSRICGYITDASASAYQPAFFYVLRMAALPSALLLMLTPLSVICCSAGWRAFCASVSLVLPIWAPPRPSISITFLFVLLIPCVSCFAIKYMLYCT